MENIIQDMIETAWKYRDYDMAEQASRLMSEFAVTVNCPSNWRDIGEKMAALFYGNDWIEENCKLYQFY